MSIPDFDFDAALEKGTLRQLQEENKTLRLRCMNLEILVADKNKEIRQIEKAAADERKERRGAEHMLQSYRDAELQHGKVFICASYRGIYPMTSDQVKQREKRQRDQL